MVCTKCNIDKLETDFYKGKNQCKSCTYEKIKQYRIDNRDKVLLNKKQYNIDNKDKIKQYRIYNKDKIKQYRIDNKDKIKQYYIDNRDKLISNNVNYERNRLKTDINFKIRHNLRSRLRCALNNNQKVGSAVRDLGCSIPEFKKYIESQFSEGMTWENHGKWHLDHKIPLSKFNLEDRSLFLIANNYTNLQPMWAVENMKKKDQSIFDYTEGVF